MTNTQTTDTAVACRSCGCTNDHACWPTCTWAEPDLCSHCSDQSLQDIAPALAGLEVPMRQLRPHPARARIRDRHAAETLRTSLGTLGQYRPVIARWRRHEEVLRDEPVLEVLAGHGIVEEAAQLGWNAVAVVVHEGIDDVTAAKIVAIDNRSSDLGDYVPEMLEELLSLIPSGEVIGYSDADIAEIRAINEAARMPEALTDVDDVPALDPVPISRTGDVWLLGAHRLVVGDGTLYAPVAAACRGDLADCYLTDPPYNVAYVGGTSDELTIENDDLDPVEFEELLLGLFDTALRQTKKGAPAYVFHADTVGALFRTLFESAGWSLRQVLIWVKDQMVLGRQDHHWQHEPILYGWKPGAPHAWYGGRTLTTVIDDERDPGEWSKAELVECVRQLREDTTVIRHDRPRVNDVHPTMKPVELLESLIVRSTRVGAMVLDTCAGSGSVLIACHHSGRVAALVEKDPRYADVIARRWQAHTGVSPVLERTGEAFNFLVDDLGPTVEVEA